jgi:putative endonuclease
MSYRPPRGMEWEQLAESFLQRRGLKTIARNFHCRLGEIDLIMMDQETLVFTEVRYRARSTYGSGAESVTLAKQKRIIRAAQKFLQIRQHHPAQTCRFDVVSMGKTKGETQINWIRAAFDASDS